MENFDPDKLIDLMKKNGEWDEEDDQMYGAEAMRKAMDGKKNPEDDDESDTDNEDFAYPQSGKDNHEELYQRRLMKKQAQM